MNISLPNVIRKAASVAALFAGIMTMFAVLFAATGQAPAALIIYPPAEYPTNLPEDIRVMRWNENTAIVTSDRRDYVRRLYKAGALLVLPVRKNGCLALQSASSRGTIS